jgi:uncharacterized membrane protein
LALQRVLFLSGAKFGDFILILTVSYLSAAYTNLMAMLILLVLFYLGIPFLVLHLCHRFRYVNKLGAVVVAYIIGVVVGNVGLLPDGSEGVQEAMTSITIPLAIPLMLFSTNLADVFKLARVTFVSLLIGLVSVVIMVVSGYFLFTDDMAEPWKMGGLLIGLYTGGTPNLAALKLMLDVDETVYLVTHSADLVIGVFYLFFLLSVGQRFFSKFLPKSVVAESDMLTHSLDGQDPYYGILKRRFLVPLSKGLVLSLLVVGVSVAVSFLVPESAQMAVIMLMITSLSLSLSFLSPVRRIPKTFELGMYFVLVFSVVVASMANVATLMAAALDVLYYVAWVVFGSLILQLLMSRLFKVDTDTMIITSTALVCSPPFVPVVAGALRNRSLVVPGLTIGIIGYAIGNYLGFLLAMLLRT